MTNQNKTKQNYEMQTQTNTKKNIYSLLFFGKTKMLLVGSNNCNNDDNHNNNVRIDNKYNTTSKKKKNLTNTK